MDLILEMTKINCFSFQVKLLEEEIRELEALEEVHEQLVESNHELEMDLREELDMAQAARREVCTSKFCTSKYYF